MPQRIIDQRKSAIQFKKDEEIIDFLAEKGICDLEKIKKIIGPNMFAIIPIEILELKSISPNAKLLYAEVMALAKKSGICFATNKYLGERLGLSLTSIPKLLRALSKEKLIYHKTDRSKEGSYRTIRVLFFDNEGDCQMTRRGTVKRQGQKRNREREIDKEIISSSATAEEDGISVLKGLGGVAPIEVVSEEPDKKNKVAEEDKKTTQNDDTVVATIENDTDAQPVEETAVATTNFNAQEALKELVYGSKEYPMQPHKRVIGMFIYFTNIKLFSKEQVGSLIARHASAASKIKSYPAKRIFETMKYLKDNADYKWTIETVGKFIDSDLKKINTPNEPKKRKVWGEDLDATKY